MTTIGNYRDAHYVNKYAALWSFGYINGFGQAEGLYRTIAHLCAEGLPSKGEPYQLLDIGCGPGRVACDLALLYRSSRVVALDQSKEMVAMATQIVTSCGEDIQCDLSRDGLGVLAIPRFGLVNVEVLVGNIENGHPCISQGQYDCITCVNVLDRVNDYMELVSTMHHGLRSNGICIIATPWNFHDAHSWREFNSNGAFIGFIESLGFSIEVSFDGLVYRELIDKRGAFEEYPLSVMRIRRC